MYHPNIYVFRKWIGTRLPQTLVSSSDWEEKRNPAIGETSFRRTQNLFFSSQSSGKTSIEKNFPIYGHFRMGVGAHPFNNS